MSIIEKVNSNNFWKIHENVGNVNFTLFINYKYKN